MVQKVHRLALVCHGQSQYNLEKNFAGRTDVDLTELGGKESIQVSIRSKAILISTALPERRAPPIL